MSKPLQQSELLSTLEPRVELHRRFEALANSAEYWQAADLQFPSNEALHQVQLQLAYVLLSCLYGCHQICPAVCLSANHQICGSLSWDL